jgi:hypothetical protein
VVFLFRSDLQESNKDFKKKVGTKKKISGKKIKV